MSRGKDTGGGENGLLGQTDNGCVIGASGEVGGLRAVVESLIELEVEGVFLMVVGFL